jgi:uncharacterized membrane protein YciS (DUF1049 family)
MPLLLENLLLLLITFAIGLAIGWLVWGRTNEEH